MDTNRTSRSRFPCALIFLGAIMIVSACVLMAAYGLAVIR